MKNWAYGFALNHEGASVGTIYYAAKYFDKEGIVNPASAEAYTDDEIKAIKDNAENYEVEASENALVGMNVLNTDEVFWYDDENGVKILASAAPLGLDAETGEMKDQEGNVVATPIK